MIGFRHTDTCLCGCHFVIGVPGEVIEQHPSIDLAIVRFDVPNPAGGQSQSKTVAYSFAEAGL